MPSTSDVAAGGVKRLTHHLTWLCWPRSIRARVQIWYAIVLLAVIGGFGGVLLYQVRANRLGQIDERLEAATRYLEAAVRTLPPHELENLPPPMPPGDEPFRVGRMRPAPPEHMRPPGGDGPARPRRDGPPPPGFDGPGPPRPRPDRGPDGPFDRPPPPRRPPLGPPLGMRVPIELPESLLERPGDLPHDRPYFIVWRSDNTVQASTSPRPETARPESPELSAATSPLLRWQRGDRQAFMAGPRGSVILVGKPMGRELAELRSFAWQTAGTGFIVLAIGLAGGWIVSRSIARPIAAIAHTASSISAANLSQRIETHDIDQELQSLATVLNDTFARLEGAFGRQSRFTADASHELRTPLAVIRSHAELALSKPRSSDEYRDTVAVCLRASTRMASLVDALLTLARADAGHLEPQLKPLDPRPIVEEIVDQAAPQADRAQISLTTALAQGLRVRGDAVFLARIVDNLLSNALRATPAGGSVQVTLEAQGDDVLLAVEDSGVGIPLEDQPHVFERFYRADKARSRSSGGNGLGLAICKSLVEAHGGQISFRSSPERGTRFEVRLPRIDAPARLVAPDEPRPLKIEQRG